MAEECLTFCSRYLHDEVKTRFGRYQTEDDEGLETEGDDMSPIFPKIGHPIRCQKKNKGNAFTMGLQLCFEAHRYVLFNTGYEQMEIFIQ